jgi:hypothetical protein
VAQLEVELAGRPVAGPVTPTGRLLEAYAALRRERDELAKVAGALWYDGNRRVHHADDAMARITADYLICHLAQAGFVLMQSGPQPSTDRRLSCLQQWI